MILFVALWVVLMELLQLPTGIHTVFGAWILFVGSLFLKMHLRHTVRDKRAALPREEPVQDIPYAVARYKCKRQA